MRLNLSLQSLGGCYFLRRHEKEQRDYPSMLISLKKTSHCYCRTHKVAARTTHTKAVTHSNTPYISGYQTVIREFQKRDQYPGDPLIHFSNVYFEVHLTFN